MAKKTSKKKAPKKSSRYLLQMTRKGVFLGICLVFFISAWMFVLGVLVGRGTAPVQFDIEALQKELIALKESIIKQEQENLHADAALAEKKQELDFYEALKSAKPEEKLKIEPSKKSATQTIETKKKQPLKPKKKVPTIQKKKAGVVSFVPNGAYAVQVVSTKDAGAAEGIVKKLKKRGYRAYKVRAEIAGKGTWYRVRVGGVDSKADAERLLKKLAGQGYKGMVVKK